MLFLSQITHCPQEESQQTQTIQIYPVGLNETLTLDVSIICQCHCEDKSDAVGIHML